jgi:hypothetical protein
MGGKTKDFSGYSVPWSEPIKGGKSTIHPTTDANFAGKFKRSDSKNSKKSTGQDGGKKGGR